jgi:zinc protease
LPQHRHHGYQSTPTFERLCKSSGLQRASGVPTDQLELTRQQELAGLQAIADDPGSLAAQLFQQTVYPNGHPYQQFPTEASLKAITQADVIKFYRSHDQPKSTVISLVGHFEPAAAEALLKRELGQWQPNASAASLQFPKVTPQPDRLSRSLPARRSPSPSSAIVRDPAVSAAD